jgi:hypothetical protein
MKMGGNTRDYGWGRKQPAGSCVAMVQNNGKRKQFMGSKIR